MVCIERKTMAYRGTYRQASVMSSGQATDGVPVKFSEKLAPPPLVSLPRNFQIGNPSEVLFMEYDFSLEEKVIKAADIQRQYREALEAHAEAQRQAQEAAKEAQREAAATAAENAEGTAEAAEDEVGPSASEEPSVPSQPTDIQSLFLNLGSGSILTPTPIIQPQPRGMNTPTHGAGGSFNLADFENEQDPFDNLELKTLNDMEELNKVLQGAQTTVAENHHTGSSQGTISQPPMPNGQASVQSHVQSQNVPHQNLKDVDYPDIDSLNVTDVNVQMQSASFYNHNADAVRPNMYSRHTGGGGQYYVDNGSYANNGYVPNLQVTRDNFTKSAPLPPIDSNAYSHSGTSIGLGQPHSSFMSQNNGVILTGSSAYFASNGCVPGVETKSLRSSRSTPDITKLDDNLQRTLPPTSHTPPPYQYGSRSRSGSQSNSRPSSRPNSRPSSPPPRPSTQQGIMKSKDWNKYSILPSTTPRSEADSKSIAPQLPDPYSSLSNEGQRLANSISDMGFRRARVARAVHKLGQDERAVLDHLCAVNRIHEQGFSHEDAEVAMHQFDQNEEKVLQYLKLLGQFKELGFSTDKIRGALISADLNENKALDLLTST